MTSFERLSVDFDGHRLSDRFTVCDVKRPLSGGPRLVTREVPGRDGSVLIGRTRGAAEVSLTLAAIDVTPQGLRSSMRELAELLDVGDPRRLSFGDEGGLYRMAIPSAYGDLETLGLVNGRVEVTFLCPDPWLLGATHSFSSLGGSCRVNVGGTLATPLVIESTGASGTYRVVDEGGRYSKVAAGQSPKALRIDGDARTVVLGGSASMLTLDSDWPVLAPGQHTLTRTSGDGEFTVTFTERWV